MKAFLLHGGQEATEADLVAPWFEFSLDALKALGNMRSKRVYVINIGQRALWMFRSSDLLQGGVIGEDALPSKSAAISAALGILIDSSSKVCFVFLVLFLQKTKTSH